MLYFHPWEFDPEQPRLPLGRARRFRTYVGLSKTQGRLSDLMASGHRFVRASDVVRRLASRVGCVGGVFPETASLTLRPS